MSEPSLGLRNLVIDRAGSRCEYHGLAQEGQEATFHVDHIHPRAAGGPISPENLALACVSCSLRKEARRSAPNQTTGRVTPLLHPRRQRWVDHFRWDDVEVVGLTATGRATVEALKMNRPSIRAIRREEMMRGRNPHV